jgi:short-subunit dehydrogenase
LQSIFNDTGSALRRQEHHPGLKVIVLAADLSDERDIEKLLGQVSEQASPVDVVVNNAGLGDSVLFDRSDWTRTRQPILPRHWCPAW